MGPDAATATTATAATATAATATAANATATLVAERIEVRGIVQGVGFRPFVHRLATELALRGTVGNDATGVVIEVLGVPNTVDDFVQRLALEAPPLARIEGLTRRPVVGPFDPDGFSIVASTTGQGPRTQISPDTAVCADCLGELFDPSDRRYRHPFITCTNCGPRFTIITGLPYDRAQTTMADFAMCERCQVEYDDPSDRRYHAQPIGCHDCGPRLQFTHVDGTTAAGYDAIIAAAAALDSGETAVIKGLGGYHLAVDATDDAAVRRLRDAKARPDKPFAVMVADLTEAEQIAVLTPSEKQLLQSGAAPIVLARRAPSSPLAASVAPNNPLIGVMLAYTPIHHLLLRHRVGPLVMTSANLAGQPIVHRDADIEPLFGPIATAVLAHDRPIAAPCDDSVVRETGDDLLPIRRGRGYAPLPVSLGSDRHLPNVLAVGGDLKNTFCLASSNHAWVSPHLGDMSSLATIENFELIADRFERLYEVTPDVVAVDAHPGYTIGRWARRRYPTRIVEIQHHTAHVGAVMAEHGLDPATPVLGFAFDGTGYGSDGAIWGGEVLRVSAHGSDRLAHLAPVPLPGGDAAVEHPARVALAHLWSAGVEWTDDLPPVSAVDPSHRSVLAQQFRTGAHCVPTTSMGRLFDAVASLVGVRHQIAYEAQAAIELEHLAASAGTQRSAAGPHRSTVSYRFEIDGDVLDQRPVIGAIADDVRAGVAPSVIAAGFHDAVAELIASSVGRFGQPNQPVVLSGGVFQNAWLTSQVRWRLGAMGVDALVHRLVPPNDGGLALGQAYLAAHLTQEVG